MKSLRAPLWSLSADSFFWEIRRGDRPSIFLTVCFFTFFLLCKLQSFSLSELHAIFSCGSYQACVIQLINILTVTKHQLEQHTTSAHCFNFLQTRTGTHTPFGVSSHDVTVLYLRYLLHSFLCCI